MSASGRVEPSTHEGHALWVRICHWILALGVLTLAFSGFFILMVHPRLYWGEVGNDLTPAWLELPISANHQPDGWQRTVTFDAVPNAPISANRAYEVFNENGWARSLHFLAGWFLVSAGALYFVIGVLTGHVARDLAPRGLTLAGLKRDVVDRWRSSPAPASGARYGLLQRVAYVTAAFAVLPVMVATGLTMSPRIAAACPWLLTVFGGHQSARTLHFFGFAGLVVFVAVHVAMVIRAGFGKKMRAMIVGN